jgi:hypothetical protein
VFFCKFELSYFLYFSYKKVLQALKSDRKILLR